MSDAILIGTMKKGRGEELHLSISEFEGRKFMDVRTFYAASDNRFLPTKKGATFGINQIDRLIELLQVARKKAVALGLLEKTSDRAPG
jgi:hypothetical protein